MKIFTIVDGVSYPGTLVRERRFHPSGYKLFYGLLEADVGGRYLAVDMWSDDPISEDRLQSELSIAIRRHLAEAAA